MDWMRHLFSAETESREDFEFLTPGTMQDDLVRLVLIKKTAPCQTKNIVPSYLFEMRPLQRNERLGRLSLRISQQTRIVMWAGHIGYFVEPRHRGNHYAARATKLVMPFAFAHKLDTVWITCNPDNPASRRSIELAGGNYVETVPIPADDPLYKGGDREKCRFCFDNSNFDSQALYSANK